MSRSTLPWVALTREAERYLTSELSLDALPLPAALRELRGTWKGQPVTVRARAYHGEQIDYARFVTVEGESLAIGNVVCWSKPDWPLPVLGGDFVDVDLETGVAVLDLSVLAASGAERGDQLRAIERAAALAAQVAGGSFRDGGDLPDWALAWFSPYALFVRVGRDQGELLARSVRPYWQCFVELARSAPRRPDAAPRVLEARRRYAKAHREQDRGLQLLGKICGASVAREFIDRVMFPDEVSP